MKKKIFKSLAVVACALLLVVGSVVGTFAYLTSQVAVTNTFTVGNVTITMDEAPVDANGKATTGERVKTNTYHIVPKGEYDKDPTITVNANSDSCYVFVKVINGLEAVEESGNTTIAKQLENNGWVELDNVANVYVYTDTAVASSAADQIIPVFTKVIIDDSVTNEALSNLDNKTVVVTAYAVQSAGFANAKAAWDATFGAPANP